jgi:hypothetical protein
MVGRGDAGDYLGNSIEEPDRGSQQAGKLSIASKRLQETKLPGGIMC